MTNEKLGGLFASAYNNQYQNYLNQKTTELFGKNEVISTKKLFQNKEIANIFENLSEVGKQKFNHILELEDSKDSVTEKEFKTLMTILDAERPDNKKDLRYLRDLQEERFWLDYSLNISNNNSIYNVSEDCIDTLFYNLYTRKEQNTKEPTQAVKKLNFVKSELEKLDKSNEGDIIRGLEIINNNFPANNEMTQKVNFSLVNSLLNGQLVRIDTRTDGGSHTYWLNNGTHQYFWDCKSGNAKIVNE